MRLLLLAGLLWYAGLAVAIPQAIYIEPGDSPISKRSALLADFGEFRVMLEPSAYSTQRGTVQLDRLAVVGFGCGDGHSKPPGRVIAAFGKLALIERTDNNPKFFDHYHHWPLKIGSTLIEKHERGRGTPDPNIEYLLQSINYDRWFADVETLAGWDRHTLGDELRFAEQWLINQFESLGLAAAREPYFYTIDVIKNNVVATVPGYLDDTRRIIIGAHLDSRNQNSASSSSPAATQNTPGAEDNASGCAGVLELARLIAEYPAPFTVEFRCFSGEEQGLVGSTRHAYGLPQDHAFELMMNLDMIGYSPDSTQRILIETESLPSQPGLINGTALIDEFVEAGQRYTEATLFTSLNAAASDHVPYLRRNITPIPATLTIEPFRDSTGTYIFSPHWHRTTDVPANMNPEFRLGEAILRLNAAVLLGRTGAADDLIFGARFE